MTPGVAAEFIVHVQKQGERQGGYSAWWSLRWPYPHKVDVSTDMHCALSLRLV